MAGRRLSVGVTTRLNLLSGHREDVCNVTASSQEHHRRSQNHVKCLCLSGVAGMSEKLQRKAKTSMSVICGAESVPIDREVSFLLILLFIL